MPSLFSELESACTYTRMQSKMKSCGYTRVEELEAELLETRVLYATTLDDYKIVSSIVPLIPMTYIYLCAQLGLASDDDKNGGLMFRVRCNKTSQLNKERTYTMKAMTNCFQNPARNEVATQPVTM